MLRILFYNKIHINNKMFIYSLYYNVFKQHKFQQLNIDSNLKQPNLHKENIEIVVAAKAEVIREILVQ